MRQDHGPPDLRKLLVLALGVCLIAAIGIGIGVTSLRNRKWANLEARVESLRRDLDSPTLARLPLGRALVPGNAWDDYIAANPYVPGQPTRLLAGSVVNWLRRDPKSSRSEVEGMVSVFTPSIDLIRKGTRREFAKAPTALLFKKGLGAQGVDVLCIAKARFLAEGGELEEALELLEDTCLFGRDVAGARIPGAATTGIHTLDSAFREIKDLLERHDFPKAELKRLDRFLQVLDDHFPEACDDLQADLLQFGDLLQREDRADDELLNLGNAGERPRRTWRYCFSTRLQAAAEFSVAEDIVSRALDLKGKPWSVEGPGNQALYQELAKSRDPLIASSLNHLSGVQWATTTRGLLRLLRAGVRYQADGEIPELENPMGGTLRSRLTEQKILFWRPSLYDGGAREPKAGPRSYYDSTTLELPRRP